MQHERNLRRQSRRARRNLVDSFERRTLLSSAIIYPSVANVTTVAGYGATPNDGIDDTAAIQPAIHALVGRKGSIETLYSLAGVYGLASLPTGRIIDSRFVALGEGGNSPAQLLPNLPNLTPGDSMVTIAYLGVLVSNRQRGLNPGPDVSSTNGNNTPPRKVFPQLPMLHANPTSGWPERCSREKRNDR